MEQKHRSLTKTKVKAAEATKEEGGKLCKDEPVSDDDIVNSDEDEPMDFKTELKEDPDQKVKVEAGEDELKDKLREMYIAIKMKRKIIKYDEREEAERDHKYRSFPTRWSYFERREYFPLLKKYGRDWKAISKELGTKTPE